MEEGDERPVRDWQAQNKDERVRELCLIACGRVSERAERWRGEAAMWVRELRDKESLEDTYT